MSISTMDLLSCLVDAARHGSLTIRRLSDEARYGNVQFKEEGDARSALTIADTAAQKVIVSSLLSKYSNLHIVGEEDESVAVDPASKVELDDTLLSRCEFYLPPSVGEVEEPPSELDVNEIVVYVDPLDGTREFVEGRLDNVQSLVGLCWRGRPLMGAIGLPFGVSSAENSTEVVFGLVGRGIGKVCTKKTSDGGAIQSCPLPAMKRYHQGDAITVSTGDSSSIRPAFEVAEAVFGKQVVVHQVVGACGNKLLRVACGNTTLAVQHDKTSLWDTAAPTAVLHSVGGYVTDYFGEPLIYTRDNPVLGNKLGVVSSAPGAKQAHLKLVKAMRGDKKILSPILEKFGLAFEDGSNQCVDIVRDLDGHPLPASYFADHMKEDVTTYSCPESEAVRGLMSNACRVHLRPSGSTVFYKRVVFARLDHARAKMTSAPHKLVRDVRSYKVETSFLASEACSSVIEKAGLSIPKCYDATLLPDDSIPLESKFSVLLEDFSPSDGWSQRWLLDSEEECRATLTTFAKMHGFFWSGSSFWNDTDAAKELEAGVWESASYVQPKLQTLNQCENVAKGWETSRLKCQKELEGFSYWDNLGERLQSVAAENGREAHPFAESDVSEKYYKYRTFTHGDPKQANLFFRSTEDGSKVGLIDFQWAGFGLAATDIAHFISAAVRADLLVDGGEESLLRYYYDELQTNLVEYGAFGSIEDANTQFSYEVFREQYETGVLDMCRLVIAYAWSRFEPVDKDDAMGCARTMNKNSYNKSMPNVIWLMSRCDAILTSRGV